MNDHKHHWPPEFCYYCGEPATKNCDGINHYLCDPKLRMLTKDPDVVGWCDRPLCDNHAKQIGMVFYQPGGGDSIDYCPKHITMKQHGIEPDLIIKSEINNHHHEKKP